MMEQAYRLPMPPRMFRSVHRKVSDLADELS
jgi:hypothetical protein